MASVMSCGKLASLLQKADRRGLRWAWMEDGRLWLGAEPLAKAAEVSLATEAVSYSVLEGTEKRPRPGGSRDDGGAGTAAASAASAVPPSSPAGQTAAAEPAVVAAPEPALATDRPGRRTGNHFADIGGQRIGAPSAKALLIGCLEYLEGRSPGTLEKLSRVKSRTKRVVARRREDLYASPSPDLRSEPIAGGWWVATTNSTPEVEKFIRRAALCGGLAVTAVGRL